MIHPPSLQLLFRSAPVALKSNYFSKQTREEFDQRGPNIFIHFLMHTTFFYSIVALFVHFEQNSGFLPKLYFFRKVRALRPLSGLFWSKLDSKVESRRKCWKILEKLGIKRQKLRFSENMWSEIIRIWQSDNCTKHSICLSDQYIIQILELCCQRLSISSFYRIQRCYIIEK